MNLVDIPPMFRKLLQKSSWIAPVLGLSLVLTLGFVLLPTLRVSAQSTISRVSTATGGLLVRSAEFKKGDSSSFYLYSGQGPFEEGYIAGKISATNVTTNDKLNSILTISSAANSQQNAGIKLLPDGSVIMGGVTNNEVKGGGGESTVIPPVDLPENFETLGQSQRNSGVYDFFLSMPPAGDADARSALYIRTMAIHDNQDPPDLIFRRSLLSGNANQFGRNQRGLYGQLLPLGLDRRGESLGGIKWQAFGDQGFSSPPNAAMWATTDDVVQGGFAPGSIYFAVGGGSQSNPSFNKAMVIRNTGNVGIGTNLQEPQATLHVFGNTKVDGSLTVGQGCRGCADLAEDYLSDETLESGDVVSIDVADPSKVIRTREKFDQKIVGVISSSPAVRINEEGGVQVSQGDATKSKGGYPVALTGRVPVKVSTENGDILPGDFLTSSSKSGVAMKATSKGAVLGKALESYTSSEVGTIKVSVNLTWYNP